MSPRIPRAFGIIGRAALLSVSVLIGFAFVPSVCADETVRVATFNCEFLIKSKVHIKYGLPFKLEDPAQIAEWNQPGFRDAKLKEATKAVARVIKTIDAHVIVLTEVGDEPDVALLRDEVAAAGIEYPHVAVCKSEDDTTGQHVAVLSKKPLEGVLKSIPGRESYDRELDDPETEGDTGVSKGMRVTFRVEGVPVHLIGVHLASERAGHEQDAQRIAQASIVRRSYLDLLIRGEHVIVAGDLNDHPGQPAVRRIRGRDDIYGDLIHTGSVDYFKSAEQDTRWTYVFQGVRQQIDHILPSRSIREACKSGGIRTRVVPVTETIGTTGLLASDHRALVVTFDFKSPE
jgi:endonuclease/exonuclease/phosphatase family metal-dependent hydrolase